MGLIFAVLFFLLGIAILLVVFLVPCRIILSKGIYSAQEPNVLPKEPVDEPIPGVARIDLQYLNGLDGSIPDAKAKSKAVVAFKPDHTKIDIGMILFKDKKGVRKPCGTAYFRYEEPYRLADKEEFVFPKGTTGVFFETRTLDDQRLAQKPLAAMSKVRILLASLVFGASAALSTVLIYLGILAFISWPKFPRLMGANFFLMLLFAGVALLLGFAGSFIALFLYYRRANFVGK